MTKQEINFASQHDWFLNTHENGVIVRDDMNKDNVLYFENFKKLKAWAGY